MLSPLATRASPRPRRFIAHKRHLTWNTVHLQWEHIQLSTFILWCDVKCGCCNAISYFYWTVDHISNEKIIIDQQIIIMHNEVMLRFSSLVCGRIRTLRISSVRIPPQQQILLEGFLDTHRKSGWRHYIRSTTLWLSNRGVAPWSFQSRRFFHHIWGK